MTPRPPVSTPSWIPRLLPRAAAALALAGLVAGLTPGCAGDSGAGLSPLAALERARAAARATASVDDARLQAADAEPGNWLAHGRTPSEQRFSPLDQIRDDNVGDLGLAWSFDMGTRRGLEATPIVADGVMYVTGTWSVVHALDARTGTLLWRHDPRVPRSTAAKACCDVVNRGVALYRGRVYSGTLDGRLLALDAATGAVVWERVTVDQSRPYTITGAPRIVKGKVVIGNGGAELGVRGYVSAYDPDTGDVVWRFYTVPGNPAEPFEHPELERAAATWSGDWWTVGGGGTVWDSMAYDPQLDLLYVGTGNGSPWSHAVRSPGGGDNLYLSSLLALRPDTGELVWHYQETPGDTWDYTATQHIILADVEIGGQPRQVLFHAPKNGFFYVLDRATGELLSAEPFVEVNWAKGIDRATGRPIPNPAARYAHTGPSDDPVVVMPSPHGAHNWHPMSYNPITGLVYVPAQDIPYFFRKDAGYRYQPGQWNLGIDFQAAHDFPREVVSGHLLAWDPLAQKEVWRAQYPGPWNGGTLTTAGNLVFQGTARGSFAAYRASDGELLFEAPAGTGIVAAPVSYAIDGEQYVSVLAGWGGAFPLAAGDAAAAAGVRDNRGRLLTWKLGGSHRLDLPVPVERPVVAIATPVDPAAAERGGRVYHRRCGTCHGVGAVSGGVLPDLRKSDPPIYDALEAIVLGGALLGKGMPRFAEWLDAGDVADLRAYLLSRRAELVASAP